MRADPERSVSEVTAAAGEAARAETEGPGILASFLEKTGTSVTGYIRNETAYRYVTPSAFSKVLTVFRAEAVTPIRNNMELTLIPRIAYDAAYDLQDVDTVSPRRGPTTILTQDQTPEILAQLQADNVRLVDVVRLEAELREAFLDIHFSRADLRLGRQIVRWGVVEGSRITDEINPLDFKEFILRDVVDRYIPLTMAKLDYYLPDSSVQFLWIPEIRLHKPAPPGTEFEQFQYLPDLAVPKSGVKNAEYAVRYSFKLMDASLAVSYFDTWDDFPAAFRSIQGVGSNSAFGITPKVDFVPTPPRLRIGGITVTRSFGPLIVSAEAAYVHGKQFGTFLGSGVTLPADVVLGAIQRDYYKWALGVDFSFLGIDWSLAYQRATIPKYDPIIITDRNDVVHALFVRKSFAGNVVTAQMLVIHFINDKEWLWRPRTDVFLTDRIKTSVGADIMQGQIADVGPRGEPLPGQFHFSGFFRNSSRVYVEIGYLF